MSHRPLGRLPPLHHVGKATAVDMEDPPEFSDSDSEFGYPYEQQESEQMETYFYEPEHPEESAKALARSFRILNPGGHVCKRQGPQSSHFTHCEQGATFGQKYADLRQLLQARAKLHLMRDFTSRINASMMFVKDLELVTREECRTWYFICHQRYLKEAPVTKLECLNAICEDLRVHMNHWNSVKQLMHTDIWLQSLLPTLSIEMDLVRTKLFHLRDCAIWWLDRFIRVGLEVLAHSDIDRLSDDALWSITRGLEEFNTIISAIRTEKSMESSSGSLLHGNQFNQSASALLPEIYANPTDLNSFKNLGESIKPIPFIKVLNILANERAKFAAMMTRHFFTESSDFVHLIHSCKLPKFPWTSSHLSPNQVRPGNNTSDYHSGTGSYMSLSTALLKVGNIAAPDLSKEPPPVSEFAAREQAFASGFLQIVCHSTSLLKKSPKSSRRGSSRSKHSPRRSKRKSDKNIESGNTKSDPKRKSVSWGDAADTGIKSQLTQKYMELLWQYFGTHLYDFWHEMAWGSPEETRGQLGHLIYCCDTLIFVIVKMVHQCCLKDLFPSGAETALITTSRRLEVTTAWAAWDTALCNAISSQSVDKCHPTPLCDDEYSTATAKLFRDAFQPLVCILGTMDNNEDTHKTKAPNGIVNNKQPSLALLLPTMQRLVMTCDVSTKWCHLKAYQFLASRALGSFLLITQSDLKLLADENRKCLYISQKMCTGSNQGNNQVETQLHSLLNAQWQQLNDMNAAIQTLSGATLKQFSENCSEQAKDFFQEYMPLGKIWKKKIPDFPIEANSYATDAVESLLEPTVMGVNKLKATAQLTSISIAVTAMCEAWTQNILKQKIRFSLHGAHQLQLDFDYGKNWLDRHLQNQEVKQSVLSLDTFKYLHSATELLKRQPHGRARSKGPPRDRKLYAAEDTSCEMTVSTEAFTSMSPTSTTEPSTDGDQEEPSKSSKASLENGEGERYKIPNMEQWLALRVQGGARNWPKLPSCFNAGPQS